MNWLRVNKLKLNSEKTEVMSVGKVKILKVIVLPTFGGVQVTLADLVESLVIILNPVFLLEKQLNAAAK